MLTKTITIVNKLGLHARAATKFVNTASRFRSKIEVIGKKRRVNGKSIMGVMTLGATKGSDLKIIVDGDDEINALAALEALIQNRFGEAE